MNSDGIYLEKGKPDEGLLKISIQCYPDGALTKSLRSYADSVMDPSLKNSVGFDVPTKNIRINNITIKLILMDLSTKSFFRSKKTIVRWREERNSSSRSASV